MQDIKKALTISIFITPAITLGLFVIGIGTGLFGIGELYNPVMQVVSKIMGFLVQPLSFIPEPVSLTRTPISAITLLLLENYVFYTSLIYLFLILTKKNSMQ